MRAKIACDQLQQRGFAHAVASDKAGALRTEGDIQMGKSGGRPSAADQARSDRTMVTGMTTNILNGKAGERCD
jgi:hypothetical protein